MDRTTLVLTLNDGTTVDSDFLPPYSIAEQIAFEEHFRCSFATIESAANANVKAAAEAAGSGGDADVDPGKTFRVTWILWFGWFRARPKVAAKFSTFLETLKDWEFVGDDLEPEPIPPESSNGIDPSMDIHAIPDGAEDGSLGPTEPIPQPSL